MMFKKYNNVRWIVHSLFWVVYFCIMLLPAMLYRPMAAKLYFSIHFLVLIVATYINIEYLIKKYFYKEQYRQYLIGLFLLWMLSLAAIQLSANFKGDYDTAKFIKLSLGALIAFSMEFFLIVMYKAAKEWYLKSQKAKELELEKVRAELNLLRSQLDAHFIFNTLNNMYLLVLNKSDKAPDALMMLSDLLSYTVYESHEDRVELAKELDFISNYINLQKLRLSSNQRVFYRVQGEVHGLIEPLLLFNFIENTFKHADGEVQINEQTYFIYIDIELDNERLTLNTINGKSKGARGIVINKGLGIENAKKRLDLAYGDMYKLKIEESVDKYRLQLTLKRQ